MYDRNFGWMMLIFGGMGELIGYFLKMFEFNEIYIFFVIYECRDGF